MKSRHDGIGFRVESAFDHAIEDDQERPHARGKRHFLGFAVGEHPLVECADHWVVSVGGQWARVEDHAQWRSPASDGRRPRMVPLSRWMAATLSRGAICLPFSVPRSALSMENASRTGSPIGQLHINYRPLDKALAATVIPAKTGIQRLNSAVSRSLASLGGLWTPASAYSGHLRLAPESRTFKSQKRLSYAHRLERLPQPALGHPGGTMELSIPKLGCAHFKRYKQRNRQVGDT